MRVLMGGKRTAGVGRVTSRSAWVPGMLALARTDTTVLQRGMNKALGGRLL